MPEKHRTLPWVKVGLSKEQQLYSCKGLRTSRDREPELPSDSLMTASTRSRDEALVYREEHLGSQAFHFLSGPMANGLEKTHKLVTALPPEEEEKRQRTVGCQVGSEFRSLP